MKSKIRVLNDITANKIAAGEVIENPASVVKELVENSIDAGASEITVEIKGGGRQLIRISDNGSGMNPDDALLCLERHATSKIRNIEDIHEIMTMGFRGEAIPSIASISKFSLITKEHNSENGSMVLVEGGKLHKTSQVACPTGTTIEVKSLFFNVPVRKKFQRSPAYDTNEILKLLTLMSLGHPNVKFHLICDQKTLLKPHYVVHKLFQDQLAQVIKDVLGIDYFDGCQCLEKNVGCYQLQGYIGLPTYSRPNRTGQYLFINKRPVVSPVIAYAIRDGYGPSLGTNRYPVFVMHINMPGDLVDINVHPQKREIRLRQEIHLKEVLIDAVRNTLQIKSTHLEESFTNDLQPITTLPPPITFERPIISKYEPLAIMKKPVFKMPEPSLFTSEEKKFSTPKPIVLAIYKHYIFADAKTINFEWEGICIIDQRAAHACILFEQLSKQETLLLQTLLIPYTFKVSHNEMQDLNTHLADLNSHGISIRQAGEDSFIVDALAQCYGEIDMHEFISELILQLNEINLQIEYKLKLLASAASKSAISNKHKLSLYEAQALVNRLILCKINRYCPQGNPTMVFLHENEIAKKFIKHER